MPREVVVNLTSGWGKTRNRNGRSITARTRHQKQSSRYKHSFCFQRVKVPAHYRCKAGGSSAPASSPAPAPSSSRVHRGPRPPGRRHTRVNTTVDQHRYNLRSRR